MPETDAPVARLAALRAFEVVAVLEGLALPLLLVATVVRYAAHAPVGVEVLGPVHASLFLAYLTLMPVVHRALEWDGRTTAIALVASLVPFGTWWFERQVHAAIVGRTRGGVGVVAGG
ncbi:MAG: DUF3817 domain-containing protein [Actinomycetes bacterium]